jgi:hypothetical protein
VTGAACAGVASLVVAAVGVIAVLAVLSAALRRRRMSWGRSDGITAAIAFPDGVVALERLVFTGRAS